MFPGEYAAGTQGYRLVARQRKPLFAVEQPAAAVVAMGARVPVADLLVSEHESIPALARQGGRALFGGTGGEIQKPQAAAEQRGKQAGDGEASEHGSALGMRPTL